MNKNENTDALKLVDEGNKSDSINSNVEENRKTIDSTLESIRDYIYERGTFFCWDDYDDIKDGYWDNDLKVLNTFLDKDPDQFKKYAQVVKNRTINYLILYYKFNWNSSREEEKIHPDTEVAKSFFENNVLGKEVFDPQNIDQDCYSIDVNEYEAKVEKCLIVYENESKLEKTKQKYGEYLSDYQGDIEALQKEDCLGDKLKFSVKLKFLQDMFVNRRTLDKRIVMYVTDKENVEEFNQKKKEFSERYPYLFTRIMLEGRPGLYKETLNKLIPEPSSSAPAAQEDISDLERNIQANRETFDNLVESFISRNDSYRTVDYVYRGRNRDLDYSVRFDNPRDIRHGLFELLKRLDIDPELFNEYSSRLENLITNRTKLYDLIHEGKIKSSNVLVFICNDFNGNCGYSHFEEGNPSEFEKLSTSEFEDKLQEYLFMEENMQALENLISDLKREDSEKPFEEQGGYFLYINSYRYVETIGLLKRDNLKKSPEEYKKLLSQDYLESKNMELNRARIDELISSYHLDEADFEEPNGEYREYRYLLEEVNLKKMPQIYRNLSYRLSEPLGNIKVNGWCLDRFIRENGFDENYFVEPDGEYSYLRNRENLKKDRRDYDELLEACRRELENIPENRRTLERFISDFYPDDRSLFEPGGMYHHLMSRENLKLDSYDYAALLEGPTTAARNGIENRHLLENFISDYCPNNRSLFEPGGMYYHLLSREKLNLSPLDYHTVLMQLSGEWRDHFFSRTRAENDKKALIAIIDAMPDCEEKNFLAELASSQISVTDPVDDNKHLILAPKDHRITLIEKIANDPEIKEMLREFEAEVKNLLDRNEVCKQLDITEDELDKKSLSEISNLILSKQDANASCKTAFSITAVVSGVVSLGTGILSAFILLGVISALPALLITVPISVLSGCVALVSIGGAIYARMERIAAVETHESIPQKRTEVQRKEDGVSSRLKTKIEEIKNKNQPVEEKPNLENSDLGDRGDK